MIDIETLATSPDSVVLTVGAIKFDPFEDTIGDDGFYMRLDVDEQSELDRHIDESTVEWWGKQAEDVREEALGDHDRQELTVFAAALNKFLVGSKKIWAQGPVFDIVILENLYRQIGIPTPWSYWQIRDSRTLFGVHGDPREKGKAGLHNALEDCISQAGAVQQVYKKAGITKRK
jgi:exodeoxyribonuclease VIII